MKKMRYNKQGWGVLPHRLANTHAGETTRKSRLVRHGWVTHYHLFPLVRGRVNSTISTVCYLNTDLNGILTLKLLSGNHKPWPRYIICFIIAHLFG